MIPERPEFNVDIPVDVVYSTLANILDKEYQKSLLFAIYERLTSLETKRNELEGRIKKKDDKLYELRNKLRRWKNGDKNIFRDSLTEEERSNLLDTFIAMIYEHDHETDHVKNAVAQMSAYLDMSEDGIAPIALFMDDLIQEAKGRLIPQDEVYLDPRKLSEHEINKLRTVVQESTGEVIKLPEESVMTQGERINFPGNHILLDIERMTPRHVDALEKSLNSNESKYISLPAHYLASVGESVDKSEIQTQRFPEEKPGGEPEEADPEMYGEDHIGSKGNPNDELPFDE